MEKFTEEEAEKQEIPAGWKVGDWKPHRISPIAYGVYYLVELFGTGRLSPHGT